MKMVSQNPYEGALEVGPLVCFLRYLWSTNEALEASRQVILRAETA